jgi:hypothetical protein
MNTYTISKRLSETFDCEFVPISDQELNIIPSNSNLTKPKFKWVLSGELHPRGMLGKHHSEASKRKISKPGTSNPMYGKKRPDLSNSNKDPTLAAKRGKSVSSHRLKQKLKRFGCSTAEELFEKIQNILAQHDCINKVGREPGSINFNKVGEYFQYYDNGVGVALRRFYIKYLLKIF